MSDHKPLPDIHDREGWRRWFKEQGYDYIAPLSEFDRAWSRRGFAARKAVVPDDDAARALIATRRRNFIG